MNEPTAASRLDLGRSRRRPRRRRSVLGLMVWIAGLALVFWVARGFYAVYHAVFVEWTVYAPGYDEGRFQQIREGMTATEVKALLGPPLFEEPCNDGSGTVLWPYTNQKSYTSNYWRRWIYMKNDRVTSIVSEFYRD